MTTEQFLSEVRKRLEAATPGKWEYQFECRKDFIGEDFYLVIGGEEDEDGHKDLIARGGVSRNNATLIANAPSDLARLIKIVEILYEANITACEEMNLAIAWLDREDQIASLKDGLEEVRSYRKQADAIAGKGDE